MRFQRRRHLSRSGITKRVLLVALVAIAIPAGVARAQSDVPVRVDYAAAPSCPGPKAFVSELTTRSHRARIAQDGDRARALVVRIDARAGKLVGTVTFAEPGGRETHRRVDGDTCAEIVSALAFVAAVAIDNEGGANAGAGSGASSGNNAGAGNAGASNPGATTNSAGSANNAVAPVTAPSAPAASADASDASRAAAAPTTAPARRGPLITTAPGEGIQGDEHEVEVLPGQAVWSAALGANGQIVSGPTPSAIGAVPFFAEVTRRSGPWLAQSARLRFERASGGGRQGDAAADFTWTVGSLDLCPVGAMKGRFRGDACVRTDAGVLDASGTGIQPSRQSSRPWASVGALVRGRATVVSSLFVEVEGAFSVPFVRDRFFVEPDTTVFQPNAVGVSAAAGLGLTLF